MKLALQFREWITQISPWLQQELDQLVAAIQTGWLQQHDVDGAHTDVRARSLRSARFGVGPVHVVELEYDRRTGNQPNNNPFFEGIGIPDGVGIVLFKAGDFPVLAPPISGFQVMDLRPTTPPETGDLIWVGRHRDSLSPIHLQVSGSQTERDYGFQVSTTADGNADNLFVLSDSAQSAVLLTPLMYLGPDVSGLNYPDFSNTPNRPWGHWHVPQLTSP